MRNRFRLSSEDGQSFVLIAIALPVLVAMVALLVDGANLFLQRRSLQTAADAAALAAAANFPSGAQAAANDYSIKNQGPGVPPEPAAV